MSGNITTQQQMNKQYINNWLNCKGESFGPPSMSQAAKEMAKQREIAKRKAAFNTFVAQVHA